MVRLSLFLRFQSAQTLQPETRSVNIATLFFCRVHYANDNVNHSYGDRANEDCDQTPKFPNR